MPSPTPRRAALVTLGCARNEVDSEELAGRLAADGWELADADSADVVLVNTCGFVESAKKDSIDTLLAAADGGRKVVAVGCLAERYGAELAASLPEADAVLGFDAYPAIGDRLDDVLAGRPVAAHIPVDRRTLLPLAPARRRSAAGAVTIPGHGPAPDGSAGRRAATGAVAIPGYGPAPDGSAGRRRSATGAVAIPGHGPAPDGSAGRRSATGAVGRGPAPVGSAGRPETPLAGTRPGPARSAGPVDGTRAAAPPVAVPGRAGGPGPFNPVDPIDPETPVEPPVPIEPPVPVEPVDPEEPTVRAARQPAGGAAPLAAGPGTGWVPPVLRRRLDHSPVAPLKLASGCDRRCAFCAIPSFRGAFVSRPPEELLAEAGWLAGQGVRELVLVSENSTSYGKDLGDLRLLEALLPELAAVPGIARVRVSYLQPAETRPSLIETIATTPGVAPYFDLSFQHASEPVLRRMRRFGGTDRFLALLDEVRAAAPEAGVRSNVIVGFPGETRADVAELSRFLTGARLDAVGVFGYSDEDGTEAAGHAGKLRRDVVDRRVSRLGRLVEELMAQRAEERVGETVEVLVESVDGAEAEGRAAHQAPEVDGGTTVTGLPAGVRVGDLVRARVTGGAGVDLTAAYVDFRDAATPAGRLVRASGA